MLVSLFAGISVPGSHPPSKSIQPPLILLTHTQKIRQESPALLIYILAIQTNTKNRQKKKTEYVR